MNQLQQRIFSQEAQAAQAGQTGRRREPRIQTARPVYVRHADPTEAPFEEVRTMANFSRDGFYFVTTRKEHYREKMHLYVTPAFGCFNFEYLGEVVRIEPLPSGEYGIAVRLIRMGSPERCSTVAKSAFQPFAPLRQTGNDQSL